MKNKFISKIDTWLLAVLIISFTSVFIAIAINFDWLSFTICTLTTLPALLFLYPCQYKVKGTTLDIQCGVIHWKKDIMKMKTIRPTRNPLSSPAMSLDRLELQFKNGEKIMISPKDKVGFKERMKSINSEINFVP